MDTFTQNCLELAPSIIDCYIKDLDIFVIPLCDIDAEDKKDILLLLSMKDNTNNVEWCLELFDDILVLRKIVQIISKLEHNIIPIKQDLVKSYESVKAMFVTILSMKMESVVGLIGRCVTKRDDILIFRCTLYTDEFLDDLACLVYDEDVDDEV